MALSPRQMAGIQKRNAEVIVTNPPNSVLSRYVPRDISSYHIGRAAQLLNYYQSQGQFETDPRKFNTLVGRGAANISGDSSNFRTPLNVKRYSLATIMDFDWAERYLPFPGRIYFAQGDSSNLRDACVMFLSLFLRYAKHSNDRGKKNHNYRLRSSMATYANNTLVSGVPDPAVLENQFGEPATVKFINIAPHAATLELMDAAMWRAARETIIAFPGVAVSYDFLNSDAIGRYYGAGTGGPKDRLKVYALPMVTFWIPVQGRGTARRLRPHGVHMQRRSGSKRVRFRKRTGVVRSLRQGVSLT